MFKARLAFGLLFVALGCVSLAAQAATPRTYFGASYSMVTYKEDGIAEEAEPKMLQLKLGVYLNEFLSFEGRIGGGVASDTIDVSATPVELDIDYVTGYYARLHLPLGDRLKPYAMAGFSNVGLTATGNFSVSDNDTDISYGFGADLGLSDAVLLNIEWVNLLDKGAAEITAVSAGVHVGF